MAMYYHYQPTVPHVALAALVLVPALYLFRVIHRLFWHPLAGTPGPRMAAWTTAYRAYYDIILDGEWSQHVESLHRQYGSVVRVGPNELHFSDPRAYADIYGSGSTFTKHSMYKLFGSSESVFAETDFHAAQKRRFALGPLFSRRATLRLEKVLQKHVDKLISRITEYQTVGTPANLYLAFRAVTLDMITSYCFGHCFDALDHPGFSHPVAISMDATLHLAWVFKHFSFLRKWVDACPEWIGLALMPGTKGYYDQANQLGSDIDEIIKNPSILHNSEHETMYHYMITKQNEKEGLPPMSRTWLLHEGLNLRFAGSETTGNACTIAAFHVLRDQNMKATLMKELDTAWPDIEAPIGYEGLERLPYLTAVIKEALRLSSGVVTPMPRVVGPSGGVIAGISVPAGTVVAMGNTIMHRNPDIFPDPYRFAPERWLQTDSANLEKYLVAFSKGPRACVGTNLAWCELYLILGTLFRKLDLTEDGTSSEDDLRFREYFIPMYRGHQLHAYVQARD
ncbi:cytochrome P450 [Crassisporium funariophilum]|nr:cytochrome P450 [Crassisporium funariophilum]